MEKIKTEKKKKHITTKQFVPKDIDCFTVIIALDGVEKMKTEKNNNETVWTIMLMWERAKSQNIYFRLQYAPKCPSK